MSSPYTEATYHPRLLTDAACSLYSEIDFLSCESVLLLELNVAMTTEKCLPKHPYKCQGVC